MLLPGSQTLALCTALLLLPGSQTLALCTALLLCTLLLRASLAAAETYTASFLTLFAYCAHCSCISPA